MSKLIQNYQLANFSITINGTQVNLGDSINVNGIIPSGAVPFGNDTSVFAVSGNLTFDGTTLTANKVTSTNDASIHGLTVGLGGGSAANNVVVGNGALNATNTGGNTTAVGASALASNTSGDYGVAFGAQTLYSNTTGTSNSGLGQGALYSNTTGGYNTAVGRSALFSNTTASNNTAVGYLAGYSNSTGAYNTFIGYQAGYSNTTGRIDAIGALTLFSNTTGVANVAIGGSYVDNIRSALYGNTTGSYNIAVGQGSLAYSTTASNNTAVGYLAGYSNSTGSGNTFVGYLAGIGSSYTGNYNTLIGGYSGFSLTSGSGNTFVGTVGSSSSAGSGYFVTTGSNNTILGGYTGNQGGLDIRTASNYIVLSDGAGNPRGVFDGSGNFFVGTTTAPTDFNARINLSYAGTGYTWGVGPTNTTSAFYVATSTSTGVSMSTSATSWSANSDERLKTSLIPFNKPLEKISLLRTGTGRYLTDSETMSRSFLIAQDVQKVLPEAVEVEENENKTLRLRYTDLIPLLVASIQEQQALIADLTNRIKTLEEKVIYT